MKKTLTKRRIARRASEIMGSTFVVGLIAIVAAGLAPLNMPDIHQANYVIAGALASPFIVLLLNIRHINKMVKYGEVIVRRETVLENRIYKSRFGQEGDYATKYDRYYKLRLTSGARSIRAESRHAPKDKWGHLYQPGTQLYTATLFYKGKKTEMFFPCEKYELDASIELER